MPHASVGATICVVVPCHNEGATIAEVVASFLDQPGVVEVLVVDNASTDGTATAAREAGARVVTESRLGKGFALITGLRKAPHADYYLMVDGDGTYPAEALPELLAAAVNGADMVVGTRLSSAEPGAFPAGHDLGNRMFIWLVRLFFRLKTRDLFSGYRLLSRRFVELVPLIARGFELELELSLQAFANVFKVVEVPVPYSQRRAGGQSKLRTFRDGWRILVALLLFFRDYRPLFLFGGLSAILLIGSLSGGSLVIKQYIETGLVLRVPLAVLSAALFLLGALSLACGVILASINRKTLELRALMANLQRDSQVRSS